MKFTSKTTESFLERLENRKVKSDSSENRISHRIFLLLKPNIYSHDV